MSCEHFLYPRVRVIPLTSVHTCQTYLDVNCKAFLYLHLKVMTLMGLNCEAFLSLHGHAHATSKLAWIVWLLSAHRVSHWGACTRHQYTWYKYNTHCVCCTCLFISLHNVNRSTNLVMIIVFLSSYEIICCRVVFYSYTT